MAAASFSQEEPAKEDKSPEPPVQIDLSKEQTDARQVAEASIIVYSGLTGRVGLSQVRKTTVEIGKITYIDPRGPQRVAEYTRRTVRGENFGEEKIRFDQKFPNGEYALIFNGGRIFGVTSGTVVFDPTEEARRSFEDRIVHGVEALLRYRENESNVELKEGQKIMGVDYYVLELTDKEQRKTTFFISKKTFRVLMLEYEYGGVKFQRKYYNHNYAQGTLVPYRTVLKADGKEIELIDIATITFGQVVDDSLFAFGEA